MLSMLVENKRTCTLHVMVGGLLSLIKCVLCEGGIWERGKKLPSSLLSLTKDIWTESIFTFFCCIFSAVEEAQQMYQRRKVALEARQNKPDLNCHYTKIKVIPILTLPMFHYMHTCTCM